jgi:hypothetical protein
LVGLGIGFVGHMGPMGLMGPMWSELCAVRFIFRKGRLGVFHVHKVHAVHKVHSVHHPAPSTLFCPSRLMCVFSVTINSSAHLFPFFIKIKSCPDTNSF